MKPFLLIIKLKQLSVIKYLVMKVLLVLYTFFEQI
jgi:hypothetical protein